jgi:hypothetical protein
MVQQPLFTPEITGITYQGSIAAYHPVTGYHDGNVIFAIRCSNCAYSFYITDLFAQLEVTQGCPRFYLCQFFPDSLLESSPGLFDRKLKV